MAHHAPPLFHSETNGGRQMQFVSEKVAVEVETLMDAFRALSRLGEALGSGGVEFLEIAERIESEMEEYYKRIDADLPNKP